MTCRKRFNLRELVGEAWGKCMTHAGIGGLQHLAGRQSSGNEVRPLEMKGDKIRGPY